MPDSNTALIDAITDMITNIETTGKFVMDTNDDLLIMVSKTVFDNAKADVVKGLANISYLPTASLAVTYNF
jgi:hypothetical protein